MTGSSSGKSSPAIRDANVQAGRDTERAPERRERGRASLHAGGGGARASRRGPPPARWLAAGALAAALAAGGCAPYAAAPAPGGSTPPVPVPRPSAPAPGATSGRAAAAASPDAAVADTTPSLDALEVLAAIPEPLSAAERVPPPEQAPPGTVTAVPTPAGAPRPAAPADSTPPPAGAEPADTTAGRPSPPGATEAPADTTASAPAAADSNGASIPVPTPTFPLGLAPPPPPDTAATDSSAAPGDGRARPATGATPSGPPAGLLAGSPPDTCWRVQLGAPDQRAKGESLRSAAESLLLAPMVIEREAGLFKVRARDCLTRAGADALRRRAIQSGFEGAFRFAGKRK